MMSAQAAECGTGTTPSARHSIRRKVKEQETDEEREARRGNVDLGRRKQAQRGDAAQILAPRGTGSPPGSPEHSHAPGLKPASATGYCRFPPSLPRFSRRGD